MIRLAIISIVLAMPISGLFENSTGHSSLKTTPDDSGGTVWIRGFTEPVRLTNVAANEDGNIAVIHIRRGELVKQGQVVVTLDKDMLEAQASIARARANSTAKLDAASIRLARAKHRFEKIQQLRSAGLGSVEELEAAQSDVDLALTEMAEATDASSLNRLELSRIETALRKRDVLSPFQGVVTDIHREVGEFVSLAERVVITVANLQQLRIPVYVSSGVVAKLSTKQRLKVRFADESKTTVGDIEYISPVSDPESGTVLVELLIDNKNGEHRSGISCQVAMPL